VKSGVALSSRAFLSGDAFGVDRPLGTPILLDNPAASAARANSTRKCPRCNATKPASGWVEEARVAEACEPRGESSCLIAGEYTARRCRSLCIDAVAPRTSHSH
jgi:hypothetical protein